MLYSLKVADVVYVERKLDTPCNYPVAFLTMQKRSGRSEHAWYFDWLSLTAVCVINLTLLPLRLAT